MGKSKRQVKNDRTLWDGLAGVYAIRNMRSRRVYVGWSTCLLSRWRAHAAQLKSGRHPVKELQADYNQQNGQAFRFTVLVAHVGGLGYEHLIVQDRLIRELEAQVPVNWHESWFINSLPSQRIYNQGFSHRGSPAFMNTCKEFSLYQDEIAVIQAFCDGKDGGKFFYDQKLTWEPLQANGIDCFQPTCKPFLRKPEFDVIQAVLDDEGISLDDLVARLMTDYATAMRPEIDRKVREKMIQNRQLYARYEEERKTTQRLHREKQQERAALMEGMFSLNG